MVTPESVAHALKVLAPVILGFLFVILGLIPEVNLSLIGAGAGLLGIPGVSQAAQIMTRGEAPSTGRHERVGLR